MSKFPVLTFSSAESADLSELVDLVPQPEKLEVGTFAQSMAIGQQQAEWIRSIRNEDRRLKQWRKNYTRLKEQNWNILNIVALGASAFGGK